MTRCKPTLRTSLLATCLAIIGCAQQAPVSVALLDQGARRVLSEAVYHTTLFETCATLGGEIELTSLQHQQDWNIANAALVYAADHQFEITESGKMIEYNGQSFSPGATFLALTAKNRAINELNFSQRSPSNRVKTCEFRFKKITPENIKLEHNPEIKSIAPTLLSILETPSHGHQAPLDIASRVPTSAKGVFHVETGPTYYQTQKSHEPHCPNSHTLTLLNRWPDEIYANFCEELPVEIITCQWGNCQPTPL